MRRVSVGRKKAHGAPMLGRRQAMRRADYRIEAVWHIQRFLGVRYGNDLSLIELDEAERRLGMHPPLSGDAFSHVRGRKLRVVWRLVQKKLLVDELSLPLVRMLKQVAQVIEPAPVRRIRPVTGKPMARN